MYALFFIIPILVWIIVAKTLLHFSFTWKEVAVQAGATSVVIAVLFLLGNIGQTYDVMFVNGNVESLEPRKRDCPWGWTSFQDSHCTEYRTRSVKVGESCSTDSKGYRSCTPIYDTEYNYDYDWERRYFVHADYEPYSDSTYEVARIDPQGVNTPPAFEAINIGDPTTKQISFTNYIRAASASLFAEEAPGEETVIAYPSVRNGWRANRVLVAGVEFDNNLWKQWNDDMMRLNSELREKQANAIVMVTGGSQSAAEMLARAWEAHNINDVVTTIGVDGETVEWVDVRSWSRNSLVDVEIRDGILNLGKLDIAEINAIIENSIKNNFELRSMDEFEYLAEEITPPLWVMILAGIILLIVTPAITYVFHKHDFF